ncbi:MAG TPA: divergent polysaccharide deacetylase family protein [Candidatus Margulisiibacteriota bacterium]|nr:divergent polysaccharide deacetylase family protein [Candidatus Margulisiibacteriota bacterium]
MPRSESRRLGWGWLLSLLSSTILGLLIFLSSLALRQPTAIVVAPSAPQPRANWAADFPARLTAVTAALGQLPWPMPAPNEEPQGAGALRWTLRRYELTLPAPENPAGIEKLFDPVRAAAAGATVDVNQQAIGAQVQIGIDGLLTHTLTLHWLGRQARVAILIDDLGNDLLIARTLVSIDTPLTLAVMPFRPFSREVAELATLFGREVLVHLPMEAESGEDFGAENVLLVAADRDAIAQQLDASLQTVPHAVGVNNHMGSRFTTDRAHMLWVLEYLKQKDLFFIDSRTTPYSVACEVAAAIKLRCAARSVFLDDTDDESAIRSQIEALPKLAREQGDVIAIGHPRPATVAALQAALPGFAAAGVQIVSASTVIADLSLARR